MLNEFYGCLIYADDILLITHTIHAMQIMLRLCDKFANDFDINFNCGKSVAVRIGKRFKENVSHCRMIIKIFCMLLKLNICVFMSALDSF